MKPVRVTKREQADQSKPSNLSKNRLELGAASQGLIPTGERFAPQVVKNNQ
jgi:hypothetical protein